MQVNCKEYSLSMRLISLQKRLSQEKVTSEERDEIQKMIISMKKKLNL